MSQRLNAILPDDIYEKLLKVAQAEKRTKSQMAAILIEEAINTRERHEELSDSPSPKREKGVA